MVSAMRAAACNQQRIPPQVTFAAAGNTGSTGTISPNWNTILLDEAGAAYTPVADDYIFICSSRGSTGQDTFAAQGYTQIGAELTSVDTATCFGNLFYKKMGGSPDTSITLNSAGVGRWSVVVLKDVDLTNPLDVAVQTITGINTAVPDCPSITTVSPGAAVVGFGVAAVPSNIVTALTIPANADTQTNRFKAGATTNAGTTFSAYAAHAMIKDNVTPGAVNLAVFGGGNTAVTGSWAAFTIAVKPK